MKVTSLVENTSSLGLPVEHGLSLYIVRKDGHRVLFDMGQSGLFAQNAEALLCPIADVQTAIVSHGHYDHGGGLPRFFECNQTALVYIHEQAFQPHYSLRDSGLRYIGLREELKSNPRLVPCGNLTRLDEKMLLFANVPGKCCLPVGNRLLFGPSETTNDLFMHEQNLLIQEDDRLVLVAGCAHRGIVNILREATLIAGREPTHVFAGMHLVKSGLSEEQEMQFIQELACELKQYSHTRFYTMHCTGTEQFHKLKDLMGEQISYLSCGENCEM